MSVRSFAAQPVPRPFVLRVARLAQDHVLAWVDQGLVSAANFLVVLFVGRWTEPRELGVYAIAFSILVLLAAAQEALVTRPYTIQKGADAPAQAFAALGLSLAFAAAATTALAAFALISTLAEASPELITIGWTLAAAAPAVLARDFARRFAFAHLAMKRAVIIDGSVAILMMLGLAALAWLGHLSAVAAIALMAAASGLVAGGWLLCARKAFAGSVRELIPAFRRSWQLGKWFLTGQVAVQIQGYTAHWLTLVLAGAAMTGVYAACVGVLALINPVLQGFYNVLTPKYVRTLGDRGGVISRRVTLDAALIATIMAMFALVIGRYGEDILLAVYGGAYRGHGQLLFILALAGLAGAIGGPASMVLAAVGKARAVAGIMAATALLNVLVISALLPAFGLVGAAYGMLAVEIAGSAGRWVAWLRCTDGLRKAEPRSQP